MSTPPHEHLVQLRFLLSGGNLRAALELLNMQSRLRFTALYRFGPAHAQNFFLVDRDDLGSPLTDDIPRNETYCSLVESLASAFVLEDSAGDARVAGHPARHAVRSYCGVPLVDAGGSVFGTLCQFDLVPARIADGTVDLMREVAANLDPAAVANARRAHFEIQVQRLADMQALMASAAEHADGLLAVFESYAEPLRADARRRLDAADALAIETRIGAIWEGLRGGAGGRGRGATMA